MSGFLSRALAGAVDACLSSLLTMMSRKYNPDTYMSKLVTWARPLTGFAAGLVAYLFVVAGVIPLRGGAIVVLAVAVTFGFSERLFLGTMAKADSYSQADAPQQPF
jgi:hypothetical protein